MKIRVRKLGDLKDPIIKFAEDAGMAEDTIDANDTQYNRRVFVRALFAMIEGTVFFIKQTTFSTSASGVGRLRIDEATILQDSTVELSSNGKPKLKTKFIRLEDNLRFTVRMLNKVYNLELDLKVGSEQWEKFKKAISIRNKITHPKSIDDFNIDDSDLLIMRDLRGWFCQFIADVVSGIFEAIKEANKKRQATANSRA